VKGQILRLAVAAKALQLAVSIRAVVKGRQVYVVQRDDGKIVVGATVEEAGEDLRVTAGATRELLSDACEILPALGEAELAETNVGLRPASPDNVPIVGQSSVERLLFATGHYRHGILLAPVSARAITEIVSSGTVPEWAALMSPARFFS
jgi:glycine oxidase